MFLPLLRTKGNDQLRAWSSRSGRATTRLYLYKITEVRRDQPYQTGLDAPSAATTEQLWLQTSQGPGRAPGKTQVVAEPMDARRADHDAAHPSATPDRVRLSRIPPIRSSRSGAGSRSAMADDTTIAPVTIQNRCRASTVRLAHPEDAGDRPDAGEDHRHAGQALHDHR